MKKILIFIIILILIIIGGYFYINRDTDKETDLTIKLNGKKEIEINYKEEYKDEGAKALFKEEDITKDIKTDTDIDFNKIGTYTYTYKIEYKKYKKEVKRTVKIVDKEKPNLVLNGNSEITMYTGSKYNEQGAKAIDNYDGDITDNVKITGSVDTSKTGEYTLKYIVKDTSDNESSVERKIKIVDKPVVKETNDTKTETVGKTSKGYTIEKKNGVYYIGEILIANKTYNLPSGYNPGNLLSVFTENFNKMASDAKKEGINLNIISGFRSYSRQQSIYNNYVSKDGQTAADRYSARPGHSEHQTGLAADINSLSQSFENTNEGKWLNNNCYKYGFIIRFVKDKENETGYMFEPWHIRYVGVDVATKLYNNGNWITLEEYLGITSKY